MTKINKNTEMEHKDNKKRKNVNENKKQLLSLSTSNESRSDIFKGLFIYKSGSVEIKVEPKSKVNLWTFEH